MDDDEPLSESDRWEALHRVIERRMTKMAIGPVELEARSGVSRETFRPILKGQPGNYRPTTLAKLSKALEFSADYLGRLVDGSATPVELALEELQLSVAAIKSDRSDSDESPTRSTRSLAEAAFEWVERHEGELADLRARVERLEATPNAADRMGEALTKNRRRSTRRET